MCVIIKSVCLKLKHRLNTIFYSAPIIDFSSIIPVFRVLDVSLALKIGLRPQEDVVKRNIAHSNLKTIPVTNEIVLVVNVCTSGEA